MKNLTILNSKEIKKTLKIIKDQFHAKLDLPYVFLKNKDNKIFLINKDIADIDLDKLNINTIGLYFCKIEKDGIRLSIEGSQIVGKKAKENIINLNEDEVKSWFRGDIIPVKKHYQGYVLLKYKKDFVGCGKYKEGKVLNFVDKGRRIETIRSTF